MKKQNPIQLLIDHLNKVEIFPPLNHSSLRQVRKIELVQEESAAVYRVHLASSDPLRSLIWKRYPSLIYSWQPKKTKEIDTYRDVLTNLNLAMVPRLYGFLRSPKDNLFWLFLEDLSPCQPLTRCFDLKHIALAMKYLALFHSQVAEKPISLSSLYVMDINFFQRRIRWAEEKLKKFYKMRKRAEKQLPLEELNKQIKNILNAMANFPPLPQTLLQSDCSPRNIFYSPQRKPPIKFIDWEEASWGNPLFDALQFRLWTEIFSHLGEEDASKLFAFYLESLKKQSSVYRKRFDVLLKTLPALRFFVIFWRAGFYAHYCLLKKNDVGIDDQKVPSQEIVFKCLKMLNFYQKRQ